MLTMTTNKTGVPKHRPQSILSAIRAFRAISEPALGEVEKSVSVKDYAKGDSLYLEDDGAQFLWFVKEGFVKEMIHTAEGRSMTLSLTGPNGLFGISALSGEEYGCHCVAETDATVIAFPIQAFQNLMARYPQVAREVIAQISKLLRRSKDTQTFAHESVPKRILHVLMELSEEFGNTIPLTRREIAEMAGTTVETCIRTFVRFEKDGLVSSVRGKIIIKNLQALVDRQEGL